MLLVERGNKLPTVAAVQYLLNRYCGARLSVDGDFGRRTVEAVKAFQHRERLPDDGAVGPGTWARLSARTSVKILDHVDAADDYHSAPGYTGYEQDLRRVGAAPLVSYHQSGGIQTVAERIAQAAGGTRSVLLVRFHGHGRPGVMNITRGRGGDFPHAHSDSVSLYDADWRDVARYFGPLHRIFSPLGSVELHGCKVGGEVYDRGRRVASGSGVGVGLYLLQRLAQLLGVPVTAATANQYSHGRAILRFEGRTITVCPDGHETIAAWASGKSL